MPAGWEAQSRSWEHGATPAIRVLATSLARRGGWWCGRDGVAEAEIKTQGTTKQGYTGAEFQLRGGRQAKVAVVVATIVTMVVFAIPHSAWGSQAQW